MADLVSPCCGAEYTDNKDGNSYCCDAPIINGICSRKKCLEHAEPEEGFVCEKCEEFFEKAVEDYEYKNQMLDAKAEDRSEAERDER
jgi:hypothetical protein